MDLKNKSILVYGLGISGKSTVKALSNMEVKVYIYDDREYEELRKDVYSIDEYNFEIIQDEVDIDWKNLYCMIKSPGIKMNNYLIKMAIENGVEVITDIELAYRLYGGENIIAITGTNGKTTTTSIVYHILQNSGVKTRIIGNIGLGILWEMYNYGLDYTYIIELSSFQLESIKEFRPKIAIITNITEDHIDWHFSFENYIKSKKNIFKNMNSQDTLILNYDDEILRNINSCNFNIKYFSLSEKKDAYLSSGKLIMNNNFIPRIDINLVGNHNISNVLAAMLACSEYGLDFSKIYNSIKTFKAIEHRIEYVTEIDGVKYYNDSKGTNIDSTKKALEGFDKNVVLLAGGYDKHIEFDNLFENNKNIKLLIALGDTKEKIVKAAKRQGIINTMSVESLEEAISLAVGNSKKGDIVLLSPACASWDQYKNFEQRGNHFKELVKKYEKK